MARTVRRRLFRWLALLLLLATVAMTAKLWLDSRDADQAVRDQVARLDQLDPGWTFEALEAKRKTPEPNSALLIVEIGKIIPKDWFRVSEPKVWAQDEEEVARFEALNKIQREIDDLEPRR